MRRALRILVLGWLLWIPAPLRAHPRDVALVDEVVDKIRENFFDPAFQGADLSELHRQARKEILDCQSWEEKSAVIQHLLAGLKTSHTTFFSPESKGYYEIQGIFSTLNGRPQESGYDGVGMETLTTPEGRFVSALWAGHPAAEAGLKVGDRIVSVDGQPYQEILSFQGRSSVTFKVQRTPQNDSVTEISVPVIAIDAAEAFEKALRESAQVVTLEGRSIGYVHIWSYAGERYHEALQELLCQGPLRECQGVVIDLRDGWGGAQPSYLNLFNSRVPRVELVDRRGRVSSLETQWRKPVGLLVNGGSRSGKELVTFGFKSSGLGPVVGTRTAGACVGGRMFRLTQGGILYLAVADVRVEGQRLEGVGVEPTQKVERPIPYCQGADPQKEAALRAVREMVP